MPQRTATIESLPGVFGMLKAMRADGPDWGTGCRQAARQAPAEIIQGRMAEDVDRWLASPKGRNGRDRRNGTYRRRLPCEPGDIEPGCRGPAATTPPPCWGATRAAREIDRVILAGFVPGLSTSRIGEVLLPLLGRLVPPATVSRGDPGRRRLTDRCKALMPGSVVPTRKTTAGAVRRPVLVAPGILPDGRKGIIEFQPADGENAAEWERLPASLHRRGPTGEGFEVICTDGGNGLPAALPPVHPDIPVRRCRADRTGTSSTRSGSPTTKMSSVTSTTS